MTTYIDSSALVPAYVPERFSKAARLALCASPQVPFTPLHALEVPNAFALLIGRGVITADDYRAIRRQLQEDIDAQRLVPLPLDWDQVFASACELSEKHTSKLLTRSLDLLHVAAAHAAECQLFVSADDRQLAVAKATGLKIVDIKRNVRHRSAEK
ncbi:MAG: type II toxin-antitoxin system VapC family toxin [Acidobacteria bacterium]|nr:type II toxin-antitoxin system VapC family toxin [Acidobacteriota bacterium]